MGVLRFLDVEAEVEYDEANDGLRVDEEDDAELGTFVWSVAVNCYSVKIEDFLDDRDEPDANGRPNINIGLELVQNGLIGETCEELLQRYRTGHREHPEAIHDILDQT